MHTGTPSPPEVALGAMLRDVAVLSCVSLLMADEVTLPARFSSVWLSSNRQLKW